MKNLKLQFKIQNILYPLSFILYILIFSAAGNIYADCVFMKNGEEKKGIIVEEYIDRVTLSTADGEIVLLKSEIKDTLYDLPVQNLIKLGDFHKEKGNIASAYVYYRKAYETDPSFELAQARYAEIKAYFLRRPDEQLEKDIERRKALLQARDGAIDTQGYVPITLQEKIYKSLGLQIISKEQRPFVAAVLPGSCAYQAGIREGDYIIAVWNRLTGYMGLEEVCDRILNNPGGEINLTIERTINLTPENSRGFDMDMTKNGLAITRILNNSLAFKKGLLESDIIVNIAGKLTRYMPVKEAVRLIGSLEKDFTIIINRNVIVWKTGD